jgi:hypothetical protein
LIKLSLLHSFIPVWGFSEDDDEEESFYAPGTEFAAGGGGGSLGPRLAPKPDDGDEKVIAVQSVSFDACSGRRLGTC